MVTDVRNKLVNSLSKVSDFNKKDRLFYNSSNSESRVSLLALPSRAEES